MAENTMIFITQGVTILTLPVLGSQDTVFKSKDSMEPQKNRVKTAWNPQKQSFPSCLVVKELHWQSSFFTYILRKNHNSLSIYSIPSL